VRPDLDPEEAAIRSSARAVQSYLKDEQLDLSVTMAAPNVPVSKVGVRITRGTVTRALARSEPKAVEETITVVGKLNGANHRTGLVEIAVVDGEPIRAKAPPPLRGLLLKRVIGSGYTFRIHRGETADGSWKLEAIDPVDPSDELIESLTLKPEPTVLTSKLVPQQNLQRVVQLVRVVASGAIASADTMGMADTDSTKRHINYIKQAAHVLRLISEAGELLSAGRTLAALPEQHVMQFLAFQFETSVVGKAWLQWSEVDDVFELDPSTAEVFLAESELGLAESMARRRGRTLRNWVRAFHASQEEAESD
jgi:hypothetical protein